MRLQGDSSESGALRIGDALTSHYLAHGLPADGGEHSAWFTVRIGGLAIPLPNPPARRRAVFFHDVNHLLTGYNTVFSDGEIRIAAFELASGCGPYAIAWIINLGVFAVGLVASPRQLFRAFVRGRNARSVYTWLDRPALQAATVDDVRAALHVMGDAPAARFEDRIVFLAWSTAAILWALLPLVAVAALLVP
jgi:hypothetical protein